MLMRGNVMSENSRNSEKTAGSGLAVVLAWPVIGFRVVVAKAGWKLHKSATPQGRAQAIFPTGVLASQEAGYATSTTHLLMPRQSRCQLGHSTDGFAAR